MKLKILFGAVMLALSLSVSTPIVLAEAPVPYVPPKPLTIPELITRYSALYSVSRTELYGTLKCESNLSPSAIGDSGASFGISQINLPSHPSITKDQALDPKFAIRYAAKEFAAGHASAWTCYRLLFW